jgi:hypothetical protein
VRLAVYLPILASVVFALAGPRLSLRARPAVAVWALSVGAGVAAAGSTWSLVLLAGSLVEEVLPDHGGRGGLLMAESPVTDGVAIAALPLLAAAGWRFAVAVRARRRLHRQLRAACLGGGADDLIVLDDPAPEAFALPGRPPYIVVSSGMLAALDSSEQRVLFAHERAHLRAGHHWHLALADAAAALNPLLRAPRDTVAFLCERWADERAGAEVGDRDLAARALARAALAAHSHPARTAPAFHECGVGQRVNALREPPPSRHVTVILGALGLAAGVLAAEIDATGDFLHLLFRVTWR